MNTNIVTEKEACVIQEAENITCTAIFCSTLLDVLDIIPIILSQGTI